MSLTPSRSFRHLAEVDAVSTLCALVLVLSLGGSTVAASLDRKHTPGVVASAGSIPETGLTEQLPRFAGLGLIASSSKNWIPDDVIGETVLPLANKETIVPVPEVDDKRQWGGSKNMALWGKRDVSDDVAVNDDDVAEEMKRKWGSKNMALWGKRATEGEEEEGEEKEDKRKWGSKNMALWGKRDDEEEKRKWGSKNMALWGKRGEEEKRKWGSKNMALWGKRDEGEKRKWGSKNMALWGKRADDSEKRKWGSKNMALWGKRADEEEKRKWGSKNMALWGKREGVNEDAVMGNWNSGNEALLGTRDGAAFEEERE